jgi:hypothetical protein
MKAGRLHEKIDIKRPTRTVNSFGDVIDTLSMWKEGVRCKITNIGTPSAGASEYIQNAQRVGEMKAEFECRWISGVQFDDVVFWNGGRFDIYSILPIGRREGMRIRARRRDNTGDSNPNS